MAIVALSASVLLVGIFSYSRRIMEEWDGVMHYASGKNLWETGEYTGWASHFWPPLQPLILGMGDPFIVGRAASYIAFLLILLSSYFYLRSKALNNHQSLIVVAYLGSISYTWLVGLQVENHSLEAALLISSIAAFIAYRSTNSIGTLLLSAIFIGLAGLTRYTSYSTALILATWLAFFPSGQKRIRDLFVFVAIFCLISSPWWWHNFWLNGSPIHTWQYLNAGSRVFPGETSEWWWIYQNNFSGFIDIIIVYPVEFFTNFIENLFRSAVLLNGQLGSQSFVALSLCVFSFVAIAWTFMRAHSRGNQSFPFIEMSIIAAFCTLSSLAFVFSTALFPVAALLLISTQAYLIKHVPWVTTLLALMILPNFVVSIYSANSYIEREADDGGQLSSYNKASQALKLLGATENSLISSINPSRALGANMDWIMAPLAGYNDLCDLLAFDFGPRVLDYIPRIPVDSAVSTPDFLVVDPSLSRRFEKLGISYPPEGNCSNLGVRWFSYPASEDVTILAVDTSRASLD